MRSALERHAALIVLGAGGVVFVYGLVVGLLLTYSRGGVAVALVAVAAWLALGGPRLEGAAALLLGGGAGVAVAVWAFSRPGLADDLQPRSPRVHDGAWFALVFVLGAVVVAALAYLGSLAEEQRPLAEARRQFVGRVALAVLAVGAAAAVLAGAGAAAGGPAANRSLSSTARSSRTSRPSSLGVRKPR